MRRAVQAVLSGRGAVIEAVLEEIDPTLVRSSLADAECQAKESECI